ncbi:MAG TPA: hypothetical protein VJZ69_05300, partial [Clostridia bacterium]|nr:hypothetical protein [Clostridia bacterium]
QILKFSEYAFNKSHAAAYAVLSYRTAFLKCYYPLHFLVAVMNNRLTKSDDLKHYMGYMKQKAVVFLSPDINRSQQSFTIENDCVRFGLMGIKNVGFTAIDEIILEREKNGNYHDMRDFASRNSFVNKRMLENLIKGGAFDCFGQTRATMLASYSKIIEVVAAERKHKDTEQLSFFDSGLIEDIPVTYDILPEYDKKKFLAFEKEVLGMYISGHPLEEYRGELSKYSFDTSMIFVKPDEIAFDEDDAQVEPEIIDEESEEKIALNMDYANQFVKFGGIFTQIEKKISKARTQSFYVGQIEDLAGTLNFSIFSPNCDKYAEFLQMENPVEVEGKLDLRDSDEPKIVLNKISNLLKSSEAKKTNFGDILWVRLEDKNQKSLVESVLSTFPGNTIVKAQIVVKNGLHDRVEQFNSVVDISSDELMFRLRNILGEKNIKIVPKKV